MFLIIPKGLFPEQDTGQLQAVITADQGASFQRMAGIQQSVADALLEDPDVASLSSNVGVDGQNPTLNSGRMLINLVPKGDRSSQSKTIARLRERASSVPGATIYLQPVQDLTIDAESGPTMYLPFSQRVTAGYVACHQPDLIDYFTEHHVQPALATGDAAFFNPRLMHGAGSNRTPDVRRMANLLQVSSPFGRAMEAVDRTAIVKAVYPVLVRRRATGVHEAQLHAALAAAAEGYAFPTDLDRDPPTGGLAPETQAHLVWHALELGWDADTLGGALDAHAARRVGSVGR